MRLRRVKLPLTIEAAETMGLRLINENPLKMTERKKTMEREEILNALKTIKRTCDENEKCPTCPLRNPNNENVCYVSRGTPNTWKIQGEENLWTAFEE